MSSPRAGDESCITNTAMQLEACPRPEAREQQGSACISQFNQPAGGTENTQHLCCSALLCQLEIITVSKFSRMIQSNYNSIITHVNSYHVGHFKEAMWSMSSRGNTLLRERHVYYLFGKPYAFSTESLFLLSPPPWSDMLCSYSYCILLLLPSHHRGPGRAKIKANTLPTPAHSGASGS